MNIRPRRDRMVARNRRDSSRRNTTEHSSDDNLSSSEDERTWNQRYYQRARLDFSPHSRIAVPVRPGRISPADPRFLFSGVNDRREPKKFAQLMRKDRPSLAERQDHAWNAEDSSNLVNLVHDDEFTFHRAPFIATTDGIRAKVGYTHGFHVWTINWPLSQRGSAAFIGVATEKCTLHTTNKSNLIGNSVEGYGWDIVNQRCSHDSDHTMSWGYPFEIKQLNQVPDKIVCILDMDEGYLAFAVNGTYLGVAFRNLRGKKLYPMAASVWGHSRVTIDYLGSLEPELLSLTSLSARKVRQNMGRDFHQKMDSLPAAPHIKKIIVDEY